MAVQILKDYRLGDMTARYVTDEEKKQVGLVLLPAGIPVLAQAQKKEQVDALVQLKIAGDRYNEPYAMGNSMRNSETVRRLEYQKQDVRRNGDRLEIQTVLAASGSYQVTHHLVWKEGSRYLRICCTIENQGQEDLMLEMFESFSLSSISPYLDGDGHEQMFLHRIRSVWSQEGRPERIPLEDLQLEPSWAKYAVRCEKFGQVGSMPVNKFFPFAAVEDQQNQVFWGAQIAHNASWQMELYRRDDALAMSGGIADRDFGHWMKRVMPGQAFTTPEAIVSVAHTDSFDVFTARLTEAALEGLEQVPQTEKSLPMIFNEYCTTWGNPSDENISAILDCIKDKGFRYFVIDAGWYKQDGVPWDISMGDYEVSQALFPQGLKQTTDKIRAAGMIPGIWFEFENVGRASKAYQMEAHLLHKDGKPLTSYARRFFDMCDPWVEQYLTDKVIGTLNRYGFGYMKIDYNETIGAGCDGTESLGEGLRRNMEASKAFIEKVKREVPGIVLENCASGGHRLEPGMMSQMSMASFSDAHECEEIPVIAANLHWVIHPAQSQIWAVIRKEDSLQRIAYSIANTFLGRMCISGDVTQLSQEQWRMIDAGMEFYKKIAPMIRDGQSYHYGTQIKSTRHPKGWQALLRIGANGKAYIVIHLFEGDLPEQIRIPLPQGCPTKAAWIYSEKEENIECIDHCLLYQPKERKKALAVLLEQ
ncbi:MAG: alpha-galactosidase [Eubacterium sp.]|nr:alpha-galactosidase [Eubacterium sp.]